MNCKVFRNKLMDYTEDALINDVKTAMDEHLEICENCRNAYKAEKAIDDILTAALNTDEIDFTSSRSLIIKNIDKNRYGKSPMKKVKFSLRKFRIQVLASAAVIVLAVFMLPMVMKVKNLTPSQSVRQDSIAYKSSSNEATLEDIKKFESPNTGVTVDQSKAQDNSAYAQISVSDQNIAEPLYNMAKATVYIPEFEITQITQQPDETKATQWTESEDGLMAVAINGRGPNLDDEAVGSIVVKNLKLGSMQELKLSNNPENYTPFYASWYDDDNLLVTIGSSLGTVSRGGDLFLINILSGKAVNIYPIHSYNSNKQIIKAIKKDGLINLTIRTMDDSNFNTYEDQTVNLNFDNIDTADESDKNNGDLQSNITKTIYKIQDVVNYGKYQDLDSCFAGGDSNSKLQLEEDFKDIEYINLLNIYKITGVSITGNNAKASNKAKEVFFVAYNCKVDTDNNIFKDGVNFLAIEVVMNDKNLGYQINKIYRLPQN